MKYILLFTCTLCMIHENYAAFTIQDFIKALQGSPRVRDDEIAYSSCPRRISQEDCLLKLRREMEGFCVRIDPTVKDNIFRVTSCPIPKCTFGYDPLPDKTKAYPYCCERCVKTGNSLMSRYD